MRVGVANDARAIVIQMLTTITNAYPCCTLARSRARVLTRVARGAARTLRALNAPYFFV